MIIGYFGTLKVGTTYTDKKIRHRGVIFEQPITVIKEVTIDDWIKYCREHDFIPEAIAVGIVAAEEGIAHFYEIESD